MTTPEIDATFQEAIASGRAIPGDRPMVLTWLVST